jgi:chromosome partitioning protein
VIDADPNRPIKSWASSENSPKNLTVIADANEDNIVDCIQEAAAATPFVVVDLKGTTS